MPRIQIELSEKQDKIVEIFKLVHDLDSKQEAIKRMIEYFEAEIKPTKLKDKDYFSV